MLGERITFRYAYKNLGNAADASFSNCPVGKFGTGGLEPALPVGKNAYDSMVGREGVLVCPNKQQEDGGENFIGFFYHGRILVLPVQVRREARLPTTQIFQARPLLSSG